MMKIIFCLFLSIMPYVTAFCEQKLVIDKTKIIPLLQNSVIQIQQDKFKNYWISTQDGIIWYNGLQCISKIEGLPLYNTYVIFKDIVNNLWARDNKSNLYFLNEKNVCAIQVPYKYIILYYKMLGIDLLLITKCKQFNQESFTYVFSNSVVNSNKFYCVVNTQDGEKQIHTFDLSKNLKNKPIHNLPISFRCNNNFHLGNFKKYTYLLVDSTFSIINRNKLQLDPILYFQLEESNQTVLTQNMIYNCIFMENKNSLYFIYNNNIFQIDNFDDSVAKCHIVHENIPIIENMICGSFNENEILIGSNTSGIHHFKKKYFKTFLYSPTENHKNVLYGIFQNGNKIYTNSGLVLDENSSYLKESNFIRDNNLKFFWDTACNTLYFQDKNSLSLHQQNLNIYKSSIIPNPQKIYIELFHKIKPNEFIVGYNNIFYHIKDNIIDTNDSIIFPKGTYVNSFFTSNDSIVWALTNQGIFSINLDNFHFRKLPYLSNINIKSAYKSKRNNIWLTTRGSGLWMFKNESFFQIPVHDDLLNCHNIVEDQNGFLWITTNNGLFQALESDLTNLSKKQLQVYFHCYDMTDGLMTNEFNFSAQNSSFYRNDSVLFLITFKGLLSFKPTEIIPILPNDSFQVIFKDNNNKIINYNSSLDLPHNFKSMEVFILDHFLGNIRNYKITYQIPEIDSQWNFIRNNKFTLTQLAPGAYTINIKKLTGFGPSSFIFQQFKIFIKPPFWQSKWFLLLSAIFIIICTYMSIYLYIQQLKKQKLKLSKLVATKTAKLQEKNIQLKRFIHQNEIFSSIVVHDIKSPINSISSISNILYQHWDKVEHSKKQSLISDIHFTAKNTLNFVNSFLVWQSNKKSIRTEFSVTNLHQLINNSFHFQLSPYYKQKNITLLNNVDHNFEILTNKQILSIILSNLIDNAIKFAEKPEIKIYAVQHANNITITIKDNGKGMNQSKIDSNLNASMQQNFNVESKNLHLGYIFINELLPIINGKIKIHSKKNIGTAVNIIIYNSTITEHSSY